VTTAAAALALVRGMTEWQQHTLRVRPLQEYHRGVRGDQLTLDLEA
jgi:hypothetical protein